jgi:uncharacterized protein with FMN-binding domain
MTKRKGKHKMLIAIITVIAVVGLAGGGALLFTEGERREAKNLPIKAINIQQLRNGTFIGDYAGGKYKWRANKIQVTIEDHKLTGIKVLQNAKTQDNAAKKELFDRVLKSQSLQVDAISGATLTSKGYLKAIELALDQAK